MKADTSSTSLQVNSSTVAGNFADVPGGGIASMGPDSSTTLSNTIVANNSGALGPFNDCGGDAIEGAIHDEGHNLVSDGSCQLSQPSSLSAVNPRLGPLADNGGPTQTMALLPGSPAINAGNNAFADGLPFDQRGPGFPRIVGPAVDMGAYVVQNLTTEPPSEVPEDKRSCKKGGWKELGFKNQGACIKAVNQAS